MQVHRGVVPTLADIAVVAALVLIVLSLFAQTKGHALLYGVLSLVVAWYALTHLDPSTFPGLVPYATFKLFPIGVAVVSAWHVLVRGPRIVWAAVLVAAVAVYFII